MKVAVLFWKIYAIFLRDLNDSPSVLKMLFHLSKHPNYVGNTLSTLVFCMILVMGLLFKWVAIGIIRL